MKISFSDIFPKFWLYKLIFAQFYFFRDKNESFLQKKNYILSLSKRHRFPGQSFQTGCLCKGSEPMTSLSIPSQITVKRSESLCPNFLFTALDFPLMAVRFAIEVLQQGKLEKRIQSAHLRNLQFWSESDGPLH